MRQGMSYQMLQQQMRFNQFLNVFCRFVFRVGIPGHGGEYQVQEGFGWTNGVALYLLKKYGQQLNIKSC